MEKGNDLSNIRKMFNKKKKLLIILFTILALVLAFVLYKQIFRQSETYTVVNGYVKKSTDSQGIIIKDEKVIDLTNNNSVITLVEQGQRVRKTESIAIYKDSNYQNYIQTIQNMDSQIETLIKDLPEVYSNDIMYIESKIDELSKDARNTTSYIKMQEYKNKIDELSNQKVKLLGELSPTGSKVRELIDQRTEFEKKYKTSSNNINSPISGCVTYKIDNLENTSSTDKILNYSSSDIDEMFNKYKNSSSNDFGIKIINNFLAYIIIKTSDNEYIKEGNNYSVKLTDNSNLDDTATLVKRIQLDNDQSYCILKLENSIENLLDSRIENFEVVWTKKSGMTVPLKAITLNKNSNIGEVTIIKNGDYTNVSVKIVLANDNIAVVSNLSDEEKSENNIESNQQLELFDQIIVKE